MSSVNDVVSHVQQRMDVLVDELLTKGAAMPEKKVFLWEEYADDNTDRGVSVDIMWHGEVLPFRIKRVLTIDERQIAQQAGIEIGVDEQGRPKLLRQDQAAYTKAVVRLGLKAWPFEYEEGKHVPINEKTVEKLDAGLLDEIAARILGITQVRRSDADPFGSPSAAA